MTISSLVSLCSNLYNTVWLSIQYDFLGYNTLLMQKCFLPEKVAMYNYKKRQLLRIYHYKMLH